MNNQHEVLSAFLDDELFDEAALRAALDDPEGRELLIDLIALRQLAQPAAVAPTAASARSAPARRKFGIWIAAATLVVATATGFMAGRGMAIQSAQPADTVTTAPPATRVVATPDTTWRDITSGSGQ